MSDPTRQLSFNGDMIIKSLREIAEVLDGVTVDLGNIVQSPKTEPVTFSSVKKIATSTHDTLIQLEQHRNEKDREDLRIQNQLDKIKKANDDLKI